jgi:CotH kinase protein
MGKDPDDLTYRQKTNEDDQAANTLDDLAQFVRVINGVGLPEGDGRFDTDAFRHSVEGILNVHAFLRWAATNLLIGSWDNYFATPASYYLYNSGFDGAADDFVANPYFTFIPWDYDNSFGIDYFDTDWQYTDLLDWPSNTRRYCAKGGHPDGRSRVQGIIHYVRMRADRAKAQLASRRSAGSPRGATELSFPAVMEPLPAAP